MKRVALQEGLEEIKWGLENKGYEVVDFNDGGHIDAIVYKSISSGMGSVNDSSDGNMFGAILVNANNKTISQIAYIIETRRYEGLFT